MKELEFNLENLFKLGLTPEILKNNFVEWMVENNDIIVDLKNNIIYYDVLNYKQELDDLLEVTKKGLLKSGKTSEEVEHLIQQQRVDVNAQFDIALEDLPERGKNEFLTHIIPKLRDNFYELKKGFYDDKLKDILETKSHKDEIQPALPSIQPVGNIDDNEHYVPDNGKQIIPKHINILNILKAPFIKIQDNYNQNCDYDFEKDINIPFKNIEALTIDLMESTNHPKILEIYLKIIYKEFQMILVTVLDVFNQNIATVGRTKNDLNEVEIYIYHYRYNLCQYYEFFKDFLDPIYFEQINEIVTGDTYYTASFQRNISSCEDSTDVHSITNIPQTINIEFEDNIGLIDEENPYPRIFINYKAYVVFKNLLEEFGTSKDNLANFSFVYHRMKKDGLIYDDFQKLQFTYFLLDFDIKIDRIKRMEEIGKKALRESIYIKAK